MEVMKAAQQQLGIMMMRCGAMIKKEGSTWGLTLEPGQ